MLITNKKILLVLVLLIVFITVGLPLAQILRYENVIKNGTSYKVKCRAYDPYDPLSAHGAILCHLWLIIQEHSPLFHAIYDK